MTIVDRCEVCGWPLAQDRKTGCVAGDCSMRPRPSPTYRERQEAGCVRQPELSYVEVNRLLDRAEKVEARISAALKLAACQWHPTCLECHKDEAFQCQACRIRRALRGEQ
jgi:hypothetical protein